MSILPELKARFRRALENLTDDVDQCLDMIRRSQDARFGDYQANFAMSLSKKLGKPAREVAAEVVSRLDLAELCDTPEVAGPGFINLRLRDDWLTRQLARAGGDPRLAVPAAERPRSFVIDYSAPNVAKPMHVGHIRSTVIGDSLYRVLGYLGLRVISDNHIGDWGTQFGMIIYVYKHLRDDGAYRSNPVEEPARLYRLVRQLMDYREAIEQVAPERQKLARREEELEERRRWLASHADKKAAKELRREETQLQDSRNELAELEKKISAVESSPVLSRLAAEHPGIGQAVLAETAALHAGDEENVRLWREFLPPCLEEIEKIYRRLGVRFDQTLGESFYHDRLAPLVDDLVKTGAARVSDGAVCVFREGHDVPMIIRKKDGAFLYGTTDLATLRYRMETWAPDAILYVVDHRQSLHFDQLFDAARRMGYAGVELVHGSFGTVMGEDGRPVKTRSGDTVGLEGLLDEAVRRAGEVVAANDDAKPDGPELAPEERARIAEIVGLGALKYADLSQNRTSDYVFSYDKMLAMNGNTATYMQYAYARVRSIFRRGNVDVESLRAAMPRLLLSTPAERRLAVELLRFGEALDLMVEDYRPNQLTSYLFELANHYSTFFEACPVLRAETAELRQSRLVLCDITARTIARGLELLGIEVVERM